MDPLLKRPSDIILDNSQSPIQVTEQAIEVLERTRRSLTTSGGSIDSKCQLLDKALVKQIRFRQAELDQAANLPNTVPVINRTSTPDPDVRREEDCLGGLGSRHNKENPLPILPEDYSLPFRSFFELLNNTPQILPHSKSLAVPTPVIQRAPNVPWSPVSGRRGKTESENSGLLSPTVSVFEFSLEESVEKRKMSVADARSNCVSAENRFKALERRFDPSRYDAAIVHHHQDKWIEDASEASDNLMQAVETLSLHDSSLQQGELQQWLSKVTQCENNLTELINNIGRKAATAVSSAVRPPAGNNVDNSARKAMVDVEVDYKIIEEKAKTLEKEIKEVDDWEEADDSTVEEFMGKLEGWKKTLEVLKDKAYSLERNTTLHFLDDTKMKAAKALIKTVECSTETAIDNIRTEDLSRGLYSMSKSKAAHVKLPNFSGVIEEDFSKFKKEVTKGFLANKVRRDDQPSKLRECLKGNAKKLIPVSMDCIEDCWSALEAMYGDPSRIMNARKRKIKQMGKFPSDETSPTSSYLSSQIEWLLTMETAIKDIIELAQGDEDMQREAYVSTTFIAITKLLPFSVQEKIAQIKAKGKDKMAKIVDLLEKLRENRQSLTKLCADQDGGGHGARDKSNSHRSGFLPREAIAYKPPQRDEACRICIVLNTEGDTDQIFEEHTHNIAVGCPRFASMPAKEKLEYAKKAKLCISCLDPKYIYRVGTPHSNCPVLEKKKHFRVKVKSVINTSCCVKSIHRKTRQRLNTARRFGRT